MTPSRSVDPSLRRPGQRPAVGWREWVRLPALGDAITKAKLDTGARTSALHAFALERFRRGGRDLVRFVVQPVQRSAEHARSVEAEIHDLRVVRSSSGHADERIVIRTPVEVLGVTFPIDLSLTRRDEMGFRLLLGREALRRRFVVDPGRSFLAGVPPGVSRRKRARARARGRTT